MKRIFSLDYGRGTMAAFTCNQLKDDGSIKPLMDAYGEPSGFACMRDETYRLGRQLYTMSGPDLRNAVEIEMNVKHLPGTHDALQIKYLRAWYQKLRKDNEAFFNECEPVWIIGCPTGEEWRKRHVIENYKKLFERAGFQNIIIVPESNAAMTGLKEADELSQKAGSNIGVICLDLGAYSCDTTYVLPGKVQSFGGYVGASLVEKMLIAKNLSGVCCKEGRNGNPPELIEAVREQYKKDPVFANYLLAHAKALKETFFTTKMNGKDYSRRDCVAVVDLDDIPAFDEFDTDSFVLSANDTVISDIIENESIQAVLGADEFAELPQEVQEELGKMTWSEALRNFVAKINDKYPAFAEAAKNGNGQCACIALTGGASLMYFVEDIIKEIFPHVQLFKDTTPMSTIAKGLLSFGPAKVKAMELEAHKDYLWNHNRNGEADTHNHQYSILNVIASKAHDILVKEIIQASVNKFIELIENNIRRWKKRYIDSDAIAGCIRDDFKRWFEGDLRSKHNEQTKKAQEYLAEEINKCYAPVLEKLRISGSLLSHTDFSMRYADNFWAEWSSERGGYKHFEKWFDPIHEWGKNLPNPGAIGGFFGTSRQEIYDYIQEDIDNAMSKIRSALRKLEETYDSPGAYTPFINECLEEITAVLKKRVREKKQSFLLEETFYEE